jgi:hypothetical protein
MEKGAETMTLKFKVSVSILNSYCFWEVTAWKSYKF